MNLSLGNGGVSILLDPTEIGLRILLKAKGFRMKKNEGDERFFFCQKTCMG